MRNNPKAEDLIRYMVEAADFATEWTEDKLFEDYVGDPFLRSAVERQLINIGESVNQLMRLDPDMSNRISEKRDIVDFRNVLAHRFFDVDDYLVWHTVINRKLPTLRLEARRLREELEDA